MNSVTADETNATSLCHYWGPMTMTMSDNEIDLLQVATMTKTTIIRGSTFDTWMRMKRFDHDNDKDNAGDLSLLTYSFGRLQKNAATPESSAVQCSAVRHGTPPEYRIAQQSQHAHASADCSLFAVIAVRVTPL